MNTANCHRTTNFLLGVRETIWSTIQIANKQDTMTRRSNEVIAKLLLESPFTFRYETEISHS